VIAQEAQPNSSFPTTDKRILDSENDVAVLGSWTFIDPRKKSIYSML
jgi:hypothetical protein